MRVPNLASECEGGIVYLFCAPATDIVQSRSLLVGVLDVGQDGGCLLLRFQPVVSSSALQVLVPRTKWCAWKKMLPDEVL